MKGIYEQITQTIRRWKREPSDNISHLVATVGSILLLFASVIVNSSNPAESLFVYSILPAYVSLSMIFLFAMWFMINDNVVLKTARDVSLTLMSQTLIVTLFSGIIANSIAISGVYLTFAFLMFLLWRFLNVGPDQPINLPGLTFTEQRRYSVTVGIISVFVLVVVGILEPDWFNSLISKLTPISSCLLLVLFWQVAKTKSRPLSIISSGVSGFTGAILLVYWGWTVRHLYQSLAQIIIHGSLVVLLFAFIYVVLFRHYVHLNAQKHKQRKREQRLKRELLRRYHN
jgi:hypothetical protein